MLRLLLRLSLRTWLMGGGVVLLLVSGLSVMLERDARLALRDVGAMDGAVTTLRDGSDLAGLDGALVHVAGRADAGAPLSDPAIGVAGDYLRIVRDVDMYQWRAVRRVDDDALRKYNYSKVWSSTPQRLPVIDLSVVGMAKQRENPDSFPIRSWTTDAPAVTVAGVPLSPALARRVPTSRDITHDPAIAEAAREIVGRPLELKDGFLQTAAAEPEIGDIRLRVHVTDPQDVTVLGEIDGGAIQSLPVGLSDRPTLRTGLHTVEAMLAMETEDLRRNMREARIAGLVCAVAGIGLLVLGWRRGRRPVTPA